VPRPRQELKVLHRTARIELRVTAPQRERCFGLLRSGGDLWSAILELNVLRHRRGDAPVVSYQALCRELSLAGPGCAGELSSVGSRSILRRYSDAWLSANAARRGGDASAHYPRRRRSLMPSRYYAGTFALEDMRLTLPTARGCPPLALRLSRPVPYPPETVRSVTLLNVGTKLFVDVTAEVPVATYEEGQGPDPAKVAGVDLGIIHPYAVVTPGAALLVSGRAIRAEHRLHLAEKKARSRALATRAPKRGQAGSRRWRKYRTRTRKLEGRHSRRVAQATHEAARVVVDFAVKERIGTLVVPEGSFEERRRQAPEPGRAQLATRTADRHPRRQGRVGRHRRGTGRRTRDQFDLPKVRGQGGQAQGSDIPLWDLQAGGAPRSCRCRQHRPERISGRGHL
jgi:hypothetical protein